MKLTVKHATLLAFFLHGALILTAQYRLSYDAYNHMFFADHYLESWWSLWEPRWYTGFDIISYPPLTHQLIALMGHVVGVDAAFGLLMWAVLTAFPAAVYGFSRIFTGPRSATFAAIGAALLPSLFLTAHTFGQFPTLMGTLLALWASVVLADFLRGGHPMAGALAVLLFATMMAAHHAVLLFTPFLMGAVFLHLFLSPNVNKLRLILRLSGFTIFAGLAALLVIWPFWDWGRTQEIQTPIDHLSRHNFITDPFAALLFFLPVYGLLIPFIPLVFRLGQKKRLWGLGLAFLVLFIFGLGDTTPFPRWVFREGWAWLTYDRFAFWASIFLLPFVGIAASVLLRNRKRQRPFVFYAGALAITGLIIGLIPTWLPTQPPALDMQPIVEFLDEADHSTYRYLTFGFGDQFAYLSRLTGATTIDGSYHTARTLPELRESGVGQIDTAVWLPDGLTALNAILQKSGERGVRWGFVDRDEYDPVLRRTGWKKIKTLSNGVEVWENPAAVLPSPVQPPNQNPFAAFSWGFFPLFTLFVTSALSVRYYFPVGNLSRSQSLKLDRQIQRWIWQSTASHFDLLNLQILSGAQAIATGLLPVSLTFWYYRKLFIVEHPRIYFTYSDALFFLSDGLALVIILLWAIQHWRSPRDQMWPGFLAKTPALQKLDSLVTNKKRAFFVYFTRPGSWLFALCLLATFSTVWSLEWRTSLYVSLHLWLCLGLYMAFRESSASWKWFAAGSCAALVLQAVVGLWQFAAQSTAMTLPLGLEWPGSLVPEMSGASVVQAVDGIRWLRVYGTLPHPNLLGGFIFAMMFGPLAGFFSSAKNQLVSILCFAAGLVVLVLTFSRSAWLALAVMGGFLLIRWKSLAWKKILQLGLTGFVILTLFVILLHPLFFSRIGVQKPETEQVSDFTRQWLVNRTWELIEQRPWLGTGMGTYPLALSEHVAAFYDIEPVHNLFLLGGSELGIGGFVILTGLVITLLKESVRAKSAAAVALSAVIIGLLVLSVFDHYFWTLAPGRVMLFSVMGLWAGKAI